MKNLSSYIHSLRSSNQLNLKKFSSQWGVHATLASRFENGERIPTQEQMEHLIDRFHLDRTEALKLWYAEQVARVLQYTELDASEILKAAESRIEYLKSAKKFDLPALSESVAAGLKKLDLLHKKWNQIRPLNTTQVSKMREYFNTAYTYESNKIEGNTLTLQETMLVVNQGLTISGKSMREHLEAINHAAAIDYLLELVQDNIVFRPRILLELHSLILQSIDRDNAGRYRTVPVRISGSEHTPPQPLILDELMDDYFSHYRKLSKQIHPVILAAEMHERLVSIHPFIDGNGRTSRLIMNLILLQNGYTIAILKGDTQARLQYYRSLEKVQMDADPEPFYKLIIERCIHSLEEHIELAGSSVGKLP